MGEGTVSFKVILVEISNVGVTIFADIGASSSEKSIFEGPKVAVARVEYIDDVADASVSHRNTRRELSDVYLSVLTTSDHCRINTVESVDSIYPSAFVFGPECSSVLHVTVTLHTTGCHALRLGSFGPTHATVFE